MSVAPYYEADGITIYCGESAGVVAQLAAQSVQLVVADPPYCGVLDADWDNQWPTEGAFLAWLDGEAAGWQRALAPNGSLYCCASPQLATRVDVQLRARFRVLANLVWEKNNGANGKVDFEVLRTFWTRNNERIVFAEQRGEGLRGAAEERHTRTEDELRGRVFEPLRAYLDGERARAGMSRQDVNRALGTCMATHWFSASQWELPTADNYAKLQGALNAQGGEFLQREYEFLRREYEELRREYEELRREYEELRRPFNLTKHDQWGEVWRFGLDRERLHPAQKPIALVQQMVRVSSRPGDLVMDPFMGSGTTLVAAKALGRRAIGVEREERYCAAAVKRLAQGVMPW